MLTVLDLQWIEWRSFAVGALSAYSLPWFAFGVCYGLTRLWIRWRRRGRAESPAQAERAPAPPKCEPDPTPGAYTVPQDDKTARYRRVLDDIFRPRERVLSRIESDALWRSVMGPRRRRTEW